MNVRTKEALRGPLGIILALFVVWALISTYWYVCSIKKLCSASLFSRTPEVGLVAINNEPIIRAEPPKVALHRLPALGIEDEGQCAPYLSSEITKATSYGEQVVKLERFLNTFEQANISEDGFYDESTAFAVAMFQEHYRPLILQNNGQPTGRVDSKTFETINMVVCNAGGMPKNK